MEIELVTWCAVIPNKIYLIIRGRCLTYQNIYQSNLLNIYQSNLKDVAIRSAVCLVCISKIEVMKINSIVPSCIAAFYLSINFLFNIQLILLSSVCWITVFVLSNKFCLGYLSLWLYKFLWTMLVMSLSRSWN